MKNLDLITIAASRKESITLRPSPRTNKEEELNRKIKNAYRSTAHLDLLDNVALTMFLEKDSAITQFKVEEAEWNAKDEEDVLLWSIKLGFTESTEPELVLKITRGIPRTGRVFTHQSSMKTYCNEPNSSQRTTIADLLIWTYFQKDRFIKEKRMIVDGYWVERRTDGVKKVDVDKVKSTLIDALSNGSMIVLERSGIHVDNPRLRNFQNSFSFITKK